MGNALPSWDPTAAMEPESNFGPCGTDVQSFRRGGPLRLLGVELETAESIDLIMQLLRNTWVNEKHERHVKGCLLFAAQQKQDVQDHQFFYDKRYESCGGRRSDVYISHVAIKKAEICQRSAIRSLSSDDVHELVRSMGVGWFNSYNRYADSLRSNGVNGSMLRELTDDDLKELGITNKLHRMRIMLEIESLEEGRSWQTFDVFVCSVGFSSDSSTVKSKDEVEEMLIDEIRNACKQQELFQGTALSIDDLSRKDTAQPLKNLEVSQSDSQQDPMPESPSTEDSFSTVPETDTAVPFEPAAPSGAWCVGEEVFFFANGRAKAALAGVVAKVHTNGDRIKVQYAHPAGGEEVTPWVALDCGRLQRRTPQEDTQQSQDST